jgi:hypothetical protein
VSFVFIEVIYTCNSQKKDIVQSVFNFSYGNRFVFADESVGCRWYLVVQKTMTLKCASNENIFTLMKSSIAFFLICFFLIYVIEWYIHVIPKKKILCSQCLIFLMETDLYLQRCVFLNPVLIVYLSMYIS